MPWQSSLDTCWDTKAVEACQEIKNTSYSEGMEKWFCFEDLSHCVFWRPTAKDTGSEGPTQGAGSTFPLEQFAVGGSTTQEKLTYKLGDPWVRS